MSEINHLIASQSTARKAVRLQALLPVKPQDRTSGDVMDKISVCIRLIKGNNGYLGSQEV